VSQHRKIFLVTWSFGKCFGSKICLNGFNPNEAQRPSSYGPTMETEKGGNAVDLNREQDKATKIPTQT